jgi:hypothetical protein
MGNSLLLPDESKVFDSIKTYKSLTPCNLYEAMDFCKNQINIVACRCILLHRPRVSNKIFELINVTSVSVAGTHSLIYGILNTSKNIIDDLENNDINGPLILINNHNAQILDDCALWDLQLARQSNIVLNEMAKYFATIKNPNLEKLMTGAIEQFLILHNARRYETLGNIENRIHTISILHLIERLQSKKKFIKQYSPSVPNILALEEISMFCCNQSVLEVEAGRGLWAFMLKSIGMDITTTSSVVKNTFIADIEALNVIDAIKKHHQTILMMNCPSFSTTLNALLNFKGNKLIYISFEGLFETGWILHKKIDISNKYVFLYIKK